ncbi:HipA N-terminal domain-containing protein [Microbacterium sp. MPKO10]|uniref:HipA N-terminal domain-containing protein n=1 Tax=Microbacterium sp. MPKO10 TaxID=2989818 RepID=UPI002235B2BB|nr:HipA N-terminal domain-containing protein [Microbacterium sp. MPKO10]MCW4457526.1 HipA N-terminal domain-containing protein [Microbacterium sp. MPKO10]
MSERNLDLYLDGLFCGVLTQSTSGNVTFTYDDAYRASQNATPLSLSMPLATRSHRKRAVLPWLQGLLPDNTDALNAIARRFNVSANNPFALLEQVGRDAAGAVQIVPAGEFASDAGQRGSVRSISEEELSRMLTRVVAEYTEGGPYSDAAGRFSLAGAQPKIALHKIGNGEWGIPEGSSPTTHIVKPVSGAFRGIDVVEQMTMRAASHLGNEVARTDVATSSAP